MEKQIKKYQSGEAPDFQEDPLYEASADELSILDDQRDEFFKIGRIQDNLIREL